MDIEAIKAEAIRIGKENSSLAAVKYIREKTGVSLSYAKSIWDKWKLDYNPLQKVITWHPISEIPNKDLEEPEYSVFVLFRQEDRLIEGYYNFVENKNIYCHDAPGFIPTQWAYIDFLPE
jgi:hypothetical protein